MTHISRENLTMKVCRLFLLCVLIPSLLTAAGAKLRGRPEDRPHSGPLQREDVEELKKRLTDFIDRLLAQPTPEARRQFLERHPLARQPQTVDGVTRLAQHSLRRGNLALADRGSETAVLIAEYVGAEPALASAYSLRGQVLQARGLWEPANRMFEQALPLTPPGSIPQAMLLNQMGVLHQQRGDLPQAQRAFQQALEILDERGAKMPQVATLTNLGAVHVRLGQPRQGLPYLERAIDLGQAIHWAPLLTWSHYWMGRALEQLGDLDQAEKHYRRATQLNERFPAQPRDGTVIRPRGSRGVPPVREALAGLWMKRGRIEWAWEQIQRHQSEQLLARFQRDGQFHTGRAELDPLLAQARKLLDRRAETEEEREREFSKPVEEQDPATLDRTAKLLAEGEAELHRVLTQIAQADPSFEHLVTTSRGSLATLQPLLPEDTVLVQYLPHETTLYILVVTRQGEPQLVSEEVRSADLETLVQRYLHLIRQGREWGESTERFVFVPSRSMEEDAGETWPIPPHWQDDGSPWYREHVGPLKKVIGELYECLMAPLEETLAAYHTVVVMPYGWLYYLPFQSLGRPNDEEGLSFLIEEKQIAYLTHQEMLNLVAHLPQSEEECLVAFADPDGSLPGAREEVAQIRQYFGKSTVWSGEEATRERVRELPNDCTIVHFACHGQAEAGDLSASFLQLADGPLTQGEIYGLRLRDKKTRTVVLSACETFIGSDEPGLEVIGLADAFATAGASTILASLWPVSDDATQRLMAEFYRHLQEEGLSKAEALRQAQLTLLHDDRFAHPRYWAPFLLIGDWR